MLPLIVDTGHTHLLNPDWDAHSRVHEVWRLSTNIFIAVIGLYLLWVSNYLLLPALLSSCIVLGFFSAIFTMSLYGGVTIGEGIEEPILLVYRQISLYLLLLVLSNQFLLFFYLKIDKDK